MQKHRLLEQALPSLFPFSLPSPPPLFAPATQAREVSGTVLTSGGFGKVEADKEKKRKRKTASARNQTWDLLLAGPFTYHYAAYGNIV